MVQAGSAAASARRRNILAWILAGLLALAFLGAGGGKFMDPDTHRENFENWGYPANFAFVIAAIEVLAALTLLHPRTATYGATVLVVDMIGAAITHAIAGEWPMIVVNVILGTLAGIVAWLRCPPWLMAKFQRTP